MKSILTAILLLMMGNLWAGPSADTFGLGAYLQGGNIHERGGLIMKYKLQQALDFDAILSFDSFGYSINGRLMYVNADIFKVPKGQLPVVFGGGGGFAGWDGGSAVKVLGSVGLNYIFANAPVDLLLRLDPTLQINFNDSGNEFGVTLKFGGRYFFF